MFARTLASVRVIAATAALCGGIVGLAHANDPVNMSVGAFSGFPTNPQSQPLDGIGNVTGSAAVDKGTLAITKTAVGFRRLSYNLYNDCTFGRSPVKSKTSVFAPQADDTTCANWFLGNVNITTRIFVDAL